MLQYCNDPLPQRRGEPLEDQMRVTLADSPPTRIRNIMAQDNVVQREERGGAVREMGYRERSRGTSVLVQEDHVGSTG